MIEAKRVVKFYLLIIKLKDTLRKGFVNAEIDRKRVESVAEHVYSVAHLALAMAIVYKRKDINLERVLCMLLVHELDEVLLGDIPVSDPNYAILKADEMLAARQVFSCLGEAEFVDELLLEFNERKTPDAKFAYHCDKLDCDLQLKVYSEEECFDMHLLKNSNKPLSSYVKTGDEHLADIWLPLDENYFLEDANFKEVFDYISTEQILDIDESNND